MRLEGKKATCQKSLVTHVEDAKNNISKDMSAKKILRSYT